MKQWHNYPAAVLQATPEQVAPALVAHYQQVPTDQLASAYAHVAKCLTVVDEQPRGTLGVALHRHLDIITAEQQGRGEAAA